MRYFKFLLAPILITLLCGAAINDGGFLRWMEQAVNGQNYVQFAPPAALSTNRTCTFQDAAAPIPFSCVGNGATTLAAADIDTSAELRAILTDEVGTGVLVFLGAPSDDAVAIGDSTTATTWRTLPNCASGNTLNYATATNLFSCNALPADDDVPEAGDFTNLSATSPITQSGGTISTSIATNRLVGRSTAGTGVMEQITPDSTLSLTGGGLSVVDVICTGCLGATEIAGLDAGDTTTGTFADARIDGSLEADEVNPTLGTQTQGNYVADVTAGTGLTKSGSAGEGWSPTLGFDFSDAGASPSLGVDECRFTSNATAAGYIVCEGDTADAFESRIAFTDPTADRVMTIPNADSNPVQPLSCGGTDKVSAISSTGAITCTADAGGAGSGDNIRVEDSDNAGTFTAMSDMDMDDSGDINFIRTAGPPDVLTAVVRADAVALGTDTTGNFVGTVADGTGVDGTCASENCTYTPVLDLTELSTVTWGAGSFTTMVFDAGATDPTWTYGSNSVALTNAATFTVGGSQVVVSSRNLTGGVGIAAIGDLSADRTITLDTTEVNSNTWGNGTFTTQVFDAGATDPTWTYGSNSVALTNAATFTVGGSAILTAATGQPLDSDLTSWAAITRATGYDTFATTPSMANLGSLLTDDASGWTTFGTTPSSANLRSLLTDEIGTGALVFLGTPADDQVPVGDSGTATTWRTIPNCPNGDLAYTQSTNTFSCTTSIQSFCVAISDETTAMTTGTAKVTFRMPYAFTLTDIRGSLNTASSSGSPIWDVNEAGTSIMTTNKILIDSGEKTSTTAVTAPTLTDTSLADDAEMTIDVDTAGTGAKGGKVCLSGRPT